MDLAQIKVNSYEKSYIIISREFPMYPYTWKYQRLLACTVLKNESNVRVRNKKKPPTL
jgi:hypothetical protein